MSQACIAVTSRSFCRNPVLRRELQTIYPNAIFNDTGLTLAGDQLIRFLSGCQKVITSLERFDENIISSLPELRLISKFGVGLDMIDMGALHRHGVRLVVPNGSNKRSVAELVVGCTLALLRQVYEANLVLRSGKWQSYRGVELSGKTIGVIGYGHIGKDVAKLFRAFDCKILVHDPYVDLLENIELDRLLRESDVISLHLSLSNETRNLINAEHLSLMKPSAYLINMARGGLIDEGALKTMLKEGRLAGAALDVFVNEPNPDQELVNLPNVLATPHIAGTTEESILAMGRAAIKGLEIENE